MVNVIYLLCGFLRMGTSGLTAQAEGAHDSQAVRDILRKSLIIGGFIALAAIIMQRPILSVLLRVISPEGEVAGLASQYFLISIWAAPAQLGIMSTSGWFIGRQNTVVPMAVSIGVNILNIALSILLVFFFKVGFVGIAWGTTTAAWCGMIAMMIIALRQIRRLPAERNEGRASVSWGRFFRVNTDLFFRSLCVMGVSLAMTSVGARLGETVLAANAVMMQFFLFFSYFMDGFAFAAEALVGKAAGARNREALREAVRGLLRWGAYMAGLFLVIYLTLHMQIVALLTDSEPVRAAVGAMSCWLVALPPVTVLAFIFDGIFIGLARTRVLLVVTLVATAVFFLVALRAGLPSFGRLWTAFETYLLLRGLLLAFQTRE